MFYVKWNFSESDSLFDFHSERLWKNYYNTSTNFHDRFWYYDIKIGELECKDNSDPSDLTNVWPNYDQTFLPTYKHIYNNYDGTAGQNI